MSRRIARANSPNPSSCSGLRPDRFNPQALFRFFSAAANGSRFNDGKFLSEIDNETNLDFIDRMLYRFAIIPMTRKAFIEQGEQLAWIQAAAEKSDEAIRILGFNRPNLMKNSCYISPPLDGIWMRAPDLQNGSVPTLRDMLEPVERRPATFYRGYDVYDRQNVGFVAQSSRAASTGWKHNVNERGNGNDGHAYGVVLTTVEKQVLLEYLKNALACGFR